MKKKVIKLNESDLQRLVVKIIKEERKSLNELGDLTGEHDIFGNLNFSNLSDEDIERIGRYFNRNKKEPIYKTNDGDLEHGTFDELDESEKWIQKAIEKKGSLRRKMGVEKDETIPSEKLNKKLDSLKRKDKDPEKPGVQGLSKSDLSTYRQIMLAKRLKKFKE